jgi:hypothetical protein
MQIEAELRRNGKSSGSFLVPSLFLKNKFSGALQQPRLIIGKTYLITIEEVKQ